MAAMLRKADSTRRPAAQPAPELPPGLFRDLFDVVPNAMVVTDYAGRIVWVNARVEALFGWKREALIGQPMEALIPQGYAAVQAGLSEAHAAAPHAARTDPGQPLTGRRHDGSEFPAALSLSPVESGGRHLVIAAVRDVTERRRVEAALVDGQKRLSEAQEIAHMGSWEWNITQNTVRWSDELYRIYGLQPNEFTATYETYMARLHPDDRPRVHESVQRAYRTQEPFEFQERIVRPTGEIRWLQSHGRVSCDARGQPTRMTGTCQDITERKRAEQSFRELLEAAPDAMVMVDAGGQIILVNSQAERMFGWDRGELLGKPVETLIPERFHPHHAQQRVSYFAAARTRSLGAGLELCGLRSDRSEFPIEISLSPVTTDTGAASMAAIRDITERKRTDEARALLAAIVENSDDAIITKTPDGIVTSWNGGAERLFGYSAAEMLGKSVDVLIPPEQHDEERSIASRIRRGEPVAHYESRRRAKGGRIIDVSLRISPLRNAQGEVVGASKIARDITERTRAERELARRAEALARSNEELEQFAYVASHDLQEPLRTVASYTQLVELRQKEQDDPRLAEYVDFITGGVRQMQGLIEDLLAYSRVNHRGHVSEPVDFNAVMKTVLDGLAGAIADSRGQVTFDRLPAVSGHRAQLAQLLQNLVGNALKYHGEAPPRVHVSAHRDAGGWQISVADDGIGIDPAHFEKIFVIFQRLHTRERYGGSGIGLALCRKIVNLHGGRLWVESAGPGRGSTFHFVLPARAPES